MQDSIASDEAEVVSPYVDGFTVGLADSAACFFDDKDACGIVPGLDVDVEVGIHFAAGDGGQGYDCGAVASGFAGLLYDFGKGGDNVGAVDGISVIHFDACFGQNGN